MGNIKDFRGWRISYSNFGVEGSPGIIWPLPFPTPPKEKGKWVAPSEFAHDCCSCCCFMETFWGFTDVNIGPTNVTGSINSQATYSLVDLAELPRSLMCGSWCNIMRPIWYPPGSTNISHQTGIGKSSTQKYLGNRIGGYAFTLLPNGWHY